MNKNKILLVEDDIYTRDVFEETLKIEGFDVEVAVDGEEGLSKLLEGGYDLVLLDVMMPKKNGLEVLKGLKESEPKKTNGPIIMTTNLGHEPVINEALKLGAKSYMIKSDIDPGEFADKVRHFLKP